MAKLSYDKKKGINMAAEMKDIKKDVYSCANDSESKSDAAKEAGPAAGPVKVAPQMPKALFGGGKKGGK